MKKKLRDVTFKEFNHWCNERVCDGKWSESTATISIAVVTAVNKVKPLSRRRKAREEYWKYLIAIFFSLDTEIEVQI